MFTTSDAQQTDLVWSSLGPHALGIDQAKPGPNHWPVRSGQARLGVLKLDLLRLVDQGMPRLVWSSIFFFFFVLTIKY